MVGREASTGHAAAAREEWEAARARRDDDDDDDCGDDDGGGDDGGDADAPPAPLQTGSRIFLDALARDFERVAEVPLPNWPFARDVVSVWRRRRGTTTAGGGGAMRSVVVAPRDEEEEGDDDDDDDDDDAQRTTDNDDDAEARAALRRARALLRAHERAWDDACAEHGARGWLSNGPSAEV